MNTRQPTPAAVLAAHRLANVETAFALHALADGSLPGPIVKALRPYIAETAELLLADLQAVTRAAETATGGTR